MLQQSKGFIINASFIKLSTDKKVGSFLLPIKGKMDTRYKKFWPMANRCCQFYIFLHVLCLIIEGVKFKKISDLL